MLRLGRIASDRDFTPLQALALLGAAAILILGRGIWLYRRGKRTLRWRPVQGRITSSVIEERGFGTLFTRQSRHYRGRIRYAYSVDERPYESDRVYFGDDRGHLRQMSVQPLLDRYPEGREVRVFHDPVNPSEAVLERGQTRGALLFLAIGGGLALIEIVALWIWFTP